MALRDPIPTRAELLALKRRIKLAEQGLQVLKMKREVLIIEMVRIVRLAKEIRKALEPARRRAEHTLAVAEMMEGSFGVTVAAVSVEDVPQVRSQRRSVMGLWLPVYEGVSLQKNLFERGYGLLGTTSVIDEAAEAYESLVMQLVELAEHEGAVRRILVELDKTSRRVNAIEKRVLPDLKAAKDRIEQRREELEREEFSRLFFIKKRKAGQEGKFGLQRG